MKTLILTFINCFDVTESDSHGNAAGPDSINNIISSQKVN